MEAKLQINLKYLISWSEIYTHTHTQTQAQYGTQISHCIWLTNKVAYKSHEGMRERKMYYTVKALISPPLK